MSSKLDSPQPVVDAVPDAWLRARSLELLRSYAEHVSHASEAPSYAPLGRLGSRYGIK